MFILRPYDISHKYLVPLMIDGHNNEPTRNVRIKQYNYGESQLTNNYHCSVSFIGVIMISCFLGLGYLKCNCIPAKLNYTRINYFVIKFDKFKHVKCLFH